ncbi:helix-turn-helix domain-containing protein, partial [Limosilactobacillus oris]
PNNTLYEYKNNDVQPTFNNMIKIADALDVSLDVFRKGVKK